MRLWDLKLWAHKESDLDPSQQPELRCNQMEENTCAFLPLQDRDSTADSFKGFHIYVLEYDISLSLSDLLHSYNTYFLLTIGSSFIHLIRTD